MVTEEALAIPAPPPRWWLRVGIALVVVCALAGGGLWAYERFLVRCADGVSRSGPYDECIGVTDGAYDFHPRLAEIVGLIEQENRDVEKSGLPWVSIVYVEPMTLGEGDKGWTSIEQELQGAYLAQRMLNENHRKPKIKLLLANPGRGSEQWRTVVDQIVPMTDDEHPVVAVAGFGQSRETTQQAVDALRREGVPMVGSTVTADSLSEKEPAGFYRAVSPNSDQAAAVVQYLKKQQKKDGDFTVEVVEDLNTEDIYSRSLREGFATAADRLGLEVSRRKLQFVSKEEGRHNLLLAIAERICPEPIRPDAVYFAGRGRDLKAFIEAAHDYGDCPVTVYTGDDAVGMFFDIPPEVEPEEYRSFLRRWEAAGITVKYTALAHPDATAAMYRIARAQYPEAASELDDGQRVYDDFLAGYTGDRPELVDRLGNESDLLNGQAMLGHDAVRIIGEAIEEVATGVGRPEVSTTSVGNWLQTRINPGLDSVKGVSGPIGFDDLGNPVKGHPLVALSPAKSAGSGASCDDEGTPAPEHEHGSRCERVLPPVT